MARAKTTCGTLGGPSPPPRSRRRLPTRPPLTMSEGGWRRSRTISSRSRPIRSPWPGTKRPYPRLWARSRRAVEGPVATQNPTLSRRTTHPDSPEQIASDQAAIDTAQAALTRVEQSLAEAGRFSSPISGTVVSVGISAGDTVSAANSSTKAIVIIGTESYEVTGTFSSSQVASVKVGDSAGVQVDGVGGALDGTVSQVGPVQSGYLGLHVTCWSSPCRRRPPACSPGRRRISWFPPAPRSTSRPCRHRRCRRWGHARCVETLSTGALQRKLIKVGMVGGVYTQVLSGLMPR